MWYVTGHPLQGGVRGPRGSRELAEAGTSGCGTERRRGLVEGLPDLEHVASYVQHHYSNVRAPHAACCAVRRPSAGRTKGGGGERGPLSGHATGEGRRGEGQGVEEGQRIHSVMRI